MAVNLTRKVQVGYKIQTVAGTAESLSAADFTGNIKSDVSNEVDVAVYDRDLAQGSISKRANLRGTRYYKPAWSEELVGGAAATAARWHQALRACGFKSTGVKKLTATANWSGSNPRFGNIIANAASSPTITGKVLRAEETGTNTYKIWYKPLTGTFINTTALYLDGADSSTTVTGSASDGGFVFDPISEGGADEIPALTVKIERFGVAEVDTDARGKCSLTMNLNEPAMAKFDFSGLAVLTAEGDWPTASPTASVPLIAAAPKMSKGLSVVVDYGNTEFEPIITQLSIDVDNTVAMRPTITTADAQDSGYVESRITDRSIKVRIDPEYVTEEDTLMLNRRAVNGDTFPMLISKGEPTDTHGCTVVYFPALQMEPGASMGDRDGIATADITMMATGSSDDEMVFCHLF